MTWLWVVRGTEASGNALIGKLHNLLSAHEGCPATEGAGSGGRGNILVFSQCRISRVDPYHRSGRS